VSVFFLNGYLISGTLFTEFFLKTKINTRENVPGNEVDITERNESDLFQVT